MQQRLAELLDARLRPAGFRRRRFNWFSSGSGVYRVCNLQMHEWGADGCEINIGFAPADRAVAGWLAENHCWLRFRIKALPALSVEERRLIDAHAVEYLGEDTWAAEVTERVIRPVTEVLTEPTDLASLGAVLRSRIPARVYVHPEFRETLGFTAADPVS